MTLKRNIAYSLIELMVVVAIVGILAAVAVPSYRNYVTKSKIAEGMSIAGRVNTYIAEYVSIEGTFPTAANVAQNVFGQSLTGTPLYISINSDSVKSINISDTSTTTTRIYYGIEYNFTVGGSDRDTLYVAARLSNDILTFECGIWNISSPYAWHIIDPGVLPGGCSSQNVSAFFAAS